MNLPKKDFKIKIAPFTFDVKYVDELKTPAGTKANGHIHMIKQEIRLAKDLTKERTEATLLHEVLHGLIHNTGLRPKFKENLTEEELVRRLGFALYGFIEDNKELFK